MEQGKKPRLVITFPTTTAAMQMEDVCEVRQGRLIPIPGALHGGCGFAWCAQPEQEQELFALMAEKGISYQEKKIILLNE